MQSTKRKNVGIMTRTLSEKWAGFSLVEVLVVMVIIALISAVGMASYKSLKNSSQISLSQREVATTIKLAQSYAIQGKTQNIDGNQQVPCGYGFRFISDSEFQIFYNKPLSGEDCQTINAGTDNNKFKFGDDFSVPIENFKLSRDVTLSSPSWETESGVYFSTPNASAYKSNGSLLGTTKTYVLQFRDVTKNVAINPNGSITED